MLILHVIPSLDPKSDSPVEALYAMAKAQTSAGLDSVILTHPADDQLAARFFVIGVNLQFIPDSIMPWMLQPENLGQLQDYLADADVVHIHGFSHDLQFQAGRVCWLQGVPYIISSHGSLSPQRLLEKGWFARLMLARKMKKLINTASAVHFSDELERDIALGLGIEAPVIVEPLPTREIPLAGNNSGLATDSRDIHRIARRWIRHYERIVSGRLKIRKAALQQLAGKQK